MMGYRQAASRSEAHLAALERVTDALGIPVQVFMRGTTVPRRAAEAVGEASTPEETWEELSAAFRRIDDPHLRRLLVEVARSLSATGG